ncbi:DUF4400 domain-containing protein [Thiohalocapsa marina]|uniref:DUF4400 domain-containing protein n=1 Tax=Thiohalocapsa marina TaxID=424902 RepID=UPI0036DDB2E7
MAAERQSQPSWLWTTSVTLGLLLMEFILLSALVPTEWSNRVRDQEIRWISAELGVASATAVFATAQGWYGALFLNTGLVDASYRLLLPDEAAVRHTPELGKLAENPIWPWMQGRLDVVWYSLYMAIQRLVVLLAWWPFLAFALVGALGDGLLRRRIRQAGFDYPSPLAHRLAVRAMLGLGIVVSLGLFAPVPIPPLAVPVLAIALAVALSLLLTQTQKRL